MVTPTLAGKTIFISGASRGIGKAIGLRAAADGANVVVAAKSVRERERLPGTIHSAAAEMEAAGGQALAVRLDLREAEMIQSAVDAAVDRFGGIDILVNNASALWLASTEETPVKRFDLVHQVNVRATFLCSATCLPHLKKAENPHILNIAPPLDMRAKWFAPHVAYTMSKYGMSMCVLGMAEEYRNDGVAVNALWPRFAIATAAIRNIIGGEEMIRRSRHPSIMSDAAHHILTRDSRACTGNFFVDEDLLRETGISDFSSYAIDPEAELQPDFFV